MSIWKKNKANGKFIQSSKRDNELDLILKLGTTIPGSFVKTFKLIGKLMVPTSFLNKVEKWCWVHTIYCFWLLLNSARDCISESQNVVQLVVLREEEMDCNPQLGTTISDSCWK